MTIERWALILMALVIIGCGPASKLRRAENLIAQAEKMGAKVKSDTVFITREVVVPKIEFDTVLRQVNFRDTITVTKDKVVTRLKIDTITKEIFVETKCPEKKVIVRVPHTVTKKISAGYTLWELIILAIAALAVGFAGGRFIKF